MLELIKKQIHMNLLRDQVATQITLDDDFIVPDTMGDMEQVIVKKGDVQIETTKNQDNRVYVKGRLEFMVLYRKAEGGLQTLGGIIPWEETINVPELLEKDYVNVTWVLDNLEAGMINSRKLNIKAIITLNVNIDAIYDIAAATDIEHADNECSTRTLKKLVDIAPIAVRKKDTYRIRQEINLPGNKPNIDNILWSSMELHGMNSRTEEKKVMISGEISVFIIYSDETHSGMVQWLEEAIPCSGEIEVDGAEDNMIPCINIKLINKDIEVRPDYDGEPRTVAVDAVLELDIKLYKEEKIQILTDIYDTGKNIIPDMQHIIFNSILTKNICRSKVSEKTTVQGDSRILQICHSEGMVCIDEVTVGDNELKVEGVVDTGILYMTDDDMEPIKALNIPVPYSCVIEAAGIGPDSLYQLIPGIEQMTAIMTGADNIEIKAAVTIEALILNQTDEAVVDSIQEKPADMALLENMPGIAGYILQPQDSLWDIAKRFNTTIEDIEKQNNISSSSVKAGTPLILVKNIANMHKSM